MIESRWWNIGIECENGGENEKLIKECQIMITDLVNYTSTNLVSRTLCTKSVAVDLNSF